MCTSSAPTNSPQTLQYLGDVQIHFQETDAKDALYFRIEFDQTIWAPFIGNREGMQQQSILDKWLWDPVASFYNPVVYAVNSFCKRVFGKAPFSYHIDQSSAFTVLDKISQVYHQKFEEVIEGQELKGLTEIYCTPIGMQGYLDGKPRSNSTLLEIHIRDAVRPVTETVARFIQEHLPYFSFAYAKSTPWTGIAGYVKESGDFLGRIANGRGKEEGWSETGLILSAEKREMGYGRQAILALLIHAWLFKNLEYPIGNELVAYFTATVSPNNEKETDLAHLIGAEVLKELNPYSETTRRYLYGIPADQIESVLKKFLDPETQITINGKKPSQFF